MHDSECYTRVTDVRAAMVEPTEHIQPLTIEVGYQGDGNAYRLNSASQLRVLERFPQAPLAESLFIGTFRPQDLARTDGSRWREIGKLLTGLTDEQIDQLGGLLILDPVHGRRLWQSAAS